MWIMIILRFIKQILESTIIGNIIGVTSFIITVYTLIIAKKIQKNIKDKQIEAVNKSKFLRHMNAYRDKLEKKRKAVLNRKVFSRNFLLDIISILNDIKTNVCIINRSDVNQIDECIKTIDKIHKNYKNYEDNSVEFYFKEFDLAISKAIRILEKGDYEI